MNENMKVLLAKIEELGWSVEEDGENEFLLGKYSPAGQDFSIRVEGETEDELLDDIFQAYQDYDVSQEAYYWLDNTGHGTNGAPYEMKDVVADMEACEKMILDLHQTLREVYQA